MDCLVEVSECRLVRVVRHRPHREDELTERGAVPQEKQGDLRVGKFSEGLEQLDCLVDPLLGVSVAVS